MIVEALYNMVVGTAGEKHARRFFPVIATIFLYVVAANWFGLLPGVATIGKVEPLDSKEGKMVDKGNVFQKVGRREHDPAGLPFLAAARTEEHCLALHVTSTPTPQEIDAQLQARRRT